MRHSLALLLPLTLLAGCVTEGPERETADRDLPTPVEKAQSTVERRIQQMRYQQGRDLLATIQSIVAMKDLAREPVLAALPESDDRTRANLIYILGYLGGTGVHQTVSKYLRHGHAGVRYEAAAALLHMGDWSTVPVLINFMDSEDRLLRYKAFQALSEGTRQDFGYDFRAPDSEREQALGRWRSWWSTRRQEIIYGKR